MRPFSLLFLAACHRAPAPAATTEPVVLHLAAINDFHGALYESRGTEDPSRALGGLPWLVAATDALRADHPDLLLLDGGDTFQGSWPVNRTFGMGSVQAFELLKVDAAAVGNHEFDYGAGAGSGLRNALEAAAKEADFAWLAANIEHADGTPWQPEGIAPWTVIERSGVKVGVIGLTTAETPQTTLLANVADLAFTDPVAAVRRALPELEAAGARVVVVVGHLTGSCETPAYASPPQDCQPDGEIGRLLTELPAGTLDLLVVGHAHTLFANRFGDTWVLEGRAKGHVINRLDLAVGPEGVLPDASVLHEPWLLEHAAVDPGCEGGDFPTAPIDVGGRELAPSTAAIALVDALEAKAGSLCDEVGCSAAPLGRSREAESGVGDWVADAMLASMQADLAVTNSGGLRADLPGGTLRREHVHAVMPFENRLVTVDLTGGQLREMLRIGSSGAHGILQVAGATYRYDPARTDGKDRDGDGAVADWERDRLCAATVRGAPIDPTKVYRVVTNDFLVGGGDHFGPVFEGRPVVETGPLMRDALEAHVRGLGACLGASAPLPAPGSPRVVVGPC